MTKIKRLELLLLSINSKQHFTLKELAEEFKVSTRTIQRDLIKLTEMGLPIVSEFGPNGGYRLEDDRILPPIGLTEMEALTILQLLDPHLQDHSPFKHAARSACRKLFEYLPQDAANILSKRKKRVLYQLPMPEKAPFLDLFIEASVKQQVVSLELLQGAEIVQSHVQPVGLFSMNGIWYCPSFCFKIKDYTIFKLENIHSASIIQDILGPKDFDEVTILNWVNNTPSSSQTFLHVLLSKSGAHEAALHPVLSQLLTLNGDGSGEIKGGLLGEELLGIAEYIWGLREHATVLEPADFLNRVAETPVFLSKPYLVSVT
jgi:predicted DNA-binding transcriptional regulator YafY